jgi:hypothetical protein
MIRQVWRLSEPGDGNLGLACTEEGLVLGRTPLIERRDGRFAVRERSEIERLLSRAYRAELPLERLMKGLATVASALNANDPALARIAAVDLRVPDLPSLTARDERTSSSSRPIGIPPCIRAPAPRQIPVGSRRPVAPAANPGSEPRNIRIPIKEVIPHPSSQSPATATLPPTPRLLMLS